MFKIGVFSKLSRVSIRMLRHYDSLGILIPNFKDESSGYRYYTADQLGLVARIRMLQQMGFTLEEVSTLLEKYQETNRLISHLEEQYHVTMQEKEKLEERLLLIQTLKENIEKESIDMSYDVTIKEMPKRKVASVRDVIPAYDQEGILWERICRNLEQDNIPVSTPQYGIAIYHDAGYKEANVDIELQVSVEKLGTGNNEIQYKEVDAVLYASTIFRGSYEKITEANRAVANWIVKNQYEIVGPSFAMYHVHPGENTSPEDYITEICYPVEKK